MDISSFMGGSFFSQLDLVSPTQLMTIGKADQQLVGQGVQAETKVCITSHENAKPLALNKTNLKRVAALYGTDASQWIGRQLLFYRSRTTFGGEPKLCVRVCGPQQAPPDPICDQQGNAVGYQPLVAAGARSAPVQPAAAVVAAPQPVTPPQSAPMRPQQQPVRPQAAPWEQPARQNSPPDA